jgi:hypothetical protein
MDLVAETNFEEFSESDRFRSRCDRPPTATRPYRIDELELPEEANDPAKIGECA